MPRIIVSTPEIPESLETTVEQDTALLIGREPDPARLLPEAHLPVRVLRVPSGQVSANHVLVRCERSGTSVQDLESRNGTLLRAPSMQPVSLPGDAVVRLELARTGGRAAPEAGPAEAEWAATADFPVAVAAAVRVWLEALDVRAEVRVGQGAAGDFLLSDGAHLSVCPPDDGTLHAQWPWLMDQIGTYVNRQNLRWEKEQGRDEDFVMASAALRRAHTEVVDAAAWGRRLVLLGPTGVGKDRLARRYHQRSRAHQGPFVAVNCSLLAPDLLYAQLFGARRGAFTGATADVPGALESAHGGTLFLDEVGELDPRVQAALLRFLDGKGEYQRLGDPAPRRAEVQIVCATNADLDEARARQGRFRDDLWYRLAVRVVRVPPLRERREDILAYLQRRPLRGTHLSAVDALSPAALQLVLGAPWPGNFRDLDNFIDRLPVPGRAQAIGVEACQAALRQGAGQPAARQGERGVAPGSEPESGVGGHLWQGVLLAAARAFEEDHGGPPRDWGQIQAFGEKYLKPVFVARALGQEEIDGLSRDLNFSELARRLHIADGTTVKGHLRRYIERFRRRG